MRPAAWQWRKAKLAIRKLGLHVAAPPLWSPLELKQPQPPLPSPQATFGADPMSLRERPELPDPSGFPGGRPQAVLLAEADREWLVELAKADDVPRPATVDREEYLGDDHLGYWLHGLGDALWLRSIADRHSIQLGEGTRILDFGSSTGRVLRHLRTLAPGAELHGTDITTAHIAWARANLPPSILISQVTVIPGLPFPDDHFDLIFAGSVFTHIDEFEESGLLELARVLKPGGVAVLTFHPERLWSEMASDPDHFLRRFVLGARTQMDPPGIEPLTEADFAGPIPGPRVVFRDLDSPIKNLNVIHSVDWVRDRWGAIFDIREIVERAHGDHQDAMVGVPRLGRG